MRKKQKHRKRPYRQPLGSYTCAAKALATSIVAIDFWAREWQHLDVGLLYPANAEAIDETLSALRGGTHASLELLSKECRVSAGSSSACSCKRFCIRCPCAACVASPSGGLFAKKKLNLVFHHDRYEITGPRSTVPCKRGECQQCIKKIRRVAGQSRAVSGNGSSEIDVFDDVDLADLDRGVPLAAAAAAAVNVFDDAAASSLPLGVPLPTSEGAAELLLRVDSPEGVASASSCDLPAHIVAGLPSHRVGHGGLPLEWTEGASTESIDFPTQRHVVGLPHLPHLSHLPLPSLFPKGPSSDDVDMVWINATTYARRAHDDDDDHHDKHDFDPLVAHETLSQQLHSIEQIYMQFAMEEAPPALMSQLAVELVEMRALLLVSLDQRPAMEADEAAGSRDRTQYTGLRDTSRSGSHDKDVDGKANKEFCRARLRRRSAGCCAHGGGRAREGGQVVVA